MKFPKGRITDVKVTGLYSFGQRWECGHSGDSPVRISFIEQKNNKDIAPDRDYYACQSCAKKILRGRRFNVFMSEG